eukprot:gene14288-biopygen11721
MRASWDAPVLSHLGRDADHPRACPYRDRMFVHRSFLVASTLGCAVAVHWFTDGPLHAALVVAAASVNPIPAAAGAGDRRRAAARRRVLAQRLAPLGAAPPTLAAPPAPLTAAPLEECNGSQRDPPAKRCGPALNNSAALAPAARKDLRSALGRACPSHLRDDTVPFCGKTLKAAQGSPRGAVHEL